jgi:fibro-slime domain-containing protein/LPXTG-motif cell wall-anchored protein
MRKMQKRIAFSSMFVLILALLFIAMPYIFGMATKSSADSDPEIGTISNYKADLFDYESSRRSSTGNFLLGETELNTDDRLLLFDEDNYYIKASNFGQDVVPRPGEHNSWMSTYKCKIVQGLVEDTMNKDGSVRLANNRVAVSNNQAVTLFDTSDKNAYKGSYSFPFENIGNGYWQYDSSKNHLEITDKVGDDGLLEMVRYNMASNIGFMPFNKLDTKKDSDENGHYALAGRKNYFFGMKIELPFVMPKDGKITTYQGNEEEMIFSFSGDDDIWVFVDGNLVLDLGGVHDAVSGTINFATGQVVTKGNHYDEATGKYNTNASSVVVNNTYIQALSVGRHTLQVYYLERGGEVSNCKITFRLQEDQSPEQTPEPESTTAPPTSSDSGNDIVESEAPDGSAIQPGVDGSANSPTPGGPGLSDVPNVNATDNPPVTEAPPGYVDNQGVEAPVLPTIPGDGPTTNTEAPSTEQPDELTNNPQTSTDDTVINTQVPTTEGVEDIVLENNRNELNDESGMINRPEVEKEKVKQIDNTKKKDDSTVSLLDEDTPLGLLPQTGTVSEVVFVVVGALFVVVASVMVVVTVRKKRK